MFAEPLRTARLISRSQRISSFDAIEVFASAAQTDSRALWLSPGRGEALVGLGTAWSVTGGGPQRFQQVASAWRELLDDAIVDGAGPVLLGGFSFDPTREPTALWAGFPTVRMVLPERMFLSRDGASWLTTNTCVQRWAFDEIVRQGQCPLSAEEWRTLVGSVARAIREERLGLSKVVLARSCQVRPTRSVQAALRVLAAEYPSCTIFAFARGGACFLGATPERLIALHGGAATTMALAGSVPRGATPDEDFALADQLLRSPKERGEHAVVVAALRDGLADVSTRVAVDAEPRLHKLSNVQHLLTSIHAQVSADHNVLDLVERLHPTPAVGGFPRQPALELIRNHEAMDRGWYAGPLGWIDCAGDGEFVVGLRSGLVRARTATLFAGCGIVAESDPATEYAEWGWKLRPMLNALGADR